MLLERYKYSINENFLDYEFNSEGPKGIIKKIVRFTYITENVFNLAFGDLGEETGKISDMVVTNNSDSRKVLATVAATFYDFTLQYPEAVVLAKGSSYSRTRLYRMGITNHLSIINADFEIFGLKAGHWELFKVEETYDAFLARRK